MVCTIVKVEPPEENPEYPPYRGGLYKVHFAEHDTPLYCYKPTYERMMFEQFMRESGVPAEMIEEYRELVIDEKADEMRDSFVL
jgi:hypothetical protein